VEIQYDVEETDEGPIGVARLRLPEKLARNMAPEELPILDRPLRFVVPRGARGAARGSTLEELQDELERPFTRDEIEQLERTRSSERDERRERTRRRFEGRSSSAEAHARDGRKVPSEWSEGRRKKGPGFRKKGRGSGGGGGRRRPR
jgi:ATP-dependent helicase HrpA